MNIKPFIFALMAASVSASAGAADAIKPVQPMAVIELFTSQGCNSCPPADAFLGELARREDVIALSLHVDYWDYLGWKDSFANRRMTERQQAYAKTMGRGRVYTPQAVIGGSAHAVGSNRSEIEALLAKARDGRQLALVVERAPGGRLKVRLPEAKADRPAAVWLISFDPRHDVAIGRGENAGNTFTYTNVVRDIVRLGTWQGPAVDFDLPVDAGSARGCAVIVQTGETGPVLGAVRIDAGGGG
jgi:hypothetical protein